jgi:hypothetical protein
VIIADSECVRLIVDQFRLADTQLSKRRRGLQPDPCEDPASIVQCNEDDEK